MVKDVAETFDQISAGPTHTPSLYSTFLRALLAAKTEPPSEVASDSGDNEAVPQMNSNPEQRQVGNSEPHYVLSEFQFASEMGPVADISTFPPTMAATQPDDGSLGMCSMDTLLGGFWDNVLVPGKFVGVSFAARDYRLMLSQGYSNPMEGLSGGFVYGAGGSGFIAPQYADTPTMSAVNSPRRPVPAEDHAVHGLGAPFQVAQPNDGSIRTGVI